MNTPSSNPTTDEASFLPPNWAVLQPLLDALLEAPAETRAARLAELSRGDATLRRQLEQLLAECERNMPFLDGPVVHRFPELTTDDETPALPKVLAGRYRIGRELGRGGMASVYLARDEKHGRDVAIKVIKSDLSASLGHDRFLREIEIAARLRHPNIVPLYDSGRVPTTDGADGSLFFVMPYEEGQSLREQLRQGGALPVAAALSVLRDVGRALAYAHEHGVVHRDIKPDNVLLSGDAAVVTDFGIAKAVSVALTASDATLTQAGTVIGTPAYMAPEQATGDAAIDHRADLYSFGCLGYELFAGHPPFQEQTSHLLIAAHIATIPRPIAEIRPDVPVPVAELLARCLAKAPAERPQSARELLPILDAAPSGGFGISSSASERQRDARRSRRVRTWAAVTSVFAVASIGGYLATRAATAADSITLAVLPFANIAGDSTIDFVADGLADEVASALARVPGVLVKSRSGARAYRGQLAPDVTEAGARLKADYLLTAVVRQEQGAWILSSELERAADATSLWDDRFVVDPNEQAAIADSIAGRLTTELRRMFPRAIGVAPTRASSQRRINSEAYRLYLRGRFFLAQRTKESLRESVRFFTAAIARDSGYASAYSGLSDAYSILSIFGYVAPDDAFPQAKAAAVRALALDSTLAEAQTSLGIISIFYDGDGPAAERALMRAIALDPQYPPAHLFYAWLLVYTGRTRLAIQEVEHARELDPGSVIIGARVGSMLYFAGRYQEAIAELRRVQELDSINPMVHAELARAWMAQGRCAEALAAANAIPAAWPNIEGSIVGYAAARCGRRADAAHVVADLEAKAMAGEDVKYLKIAEIYVGLGNNDAAITWLNRMRPTFFLAYVKINPLFKPLHSDPRYAALVRRIGLEP